MDSFKQLIPIFITVLFLLLTVRANSAPSCSEIFFNSHQAPTTRNLFQRARQLAGKKQFSEALQLIDSLLENEPGNIFVLTLKSQILIEIGQYQSAYTTALVGLSLVADDSILLGLSAKALLGLNETERALEVIRLGLNLHPADRFLVSTQIRTLLLLGRFAEALSTSAYHLQLAPHDPLAFEYKVRALQGLSRHEDALKVIEKASKVLPMKGALQTFLILKAQSLIALAKYKLATTLLQHDLRTYPIRSQIAVMKVQILLSMASQSPNEIKLALVTDALSQLQQLPNEITVLWLRVWAHQLGGDTTQWKKDIESIYEMSTGYDHYLLTLLLRGFQNQLRPTTPEIIPHGLDTAQRDKLKELLNLDMLTLWHQILVFTRTQLDLRQ